jgi:multiple sugar transport system substrate-binding protein
MKRSRLYILVAALVTTVLLLAACAPVTAPSAAQPAGQAAASSAPVEITYWHTMSDPETAQFDKVVAAFEAANPGIKVKTTRYAYDDFKPALLTALAGDAGPDTARLDIAWVPEFADQGALAQLDGKLADLDAIKAATFPGPMSTNLWKDHYYGLPQDTNTQVLLWNADNFAAAGIAAPPATMEEFAADACKLSDAAKEQYGYALGGTYFWAPAPIFYAMGGKVVDDKITTATGYINGPESVAAFSMLLDLYNKGCISPNVLGGGIGTADGHATGKYGMIIDGPWMVDIYKGNYPDFKVNFAPIPTGASGTTSSVVGGEDVVVFSGSKQSDAAIKWAAYLLTPEAQKLMAEVGVMPTLSALTGDASMPAHFGVFMEQLKTAQARVPHPKWGDMDTAINNAFQRILRGEQIPQEALDQAATEIDALLK